jgi:peptidylprolyl isomerase
VAVIVAVNAFGGPSTKLSDGTDVREPDPGLKDLSEGVKCRDLKGGVGEAECPEGASVKVHYTGWLPDGTVFDSSRESGKPIEFNLDRDIIVGWREGIPGMKKGGVRKLVIAPEKGYGAKGNGKIPPDATLVFEVELLAFTEAVDPKIKARPRRSPVPADRSKLSDGTAPTDDDPKLQPVGKDGLLVRDLKVGDGPEVQIGRWAVVDYTGWRRSDGKEFDSSFRHAEPFKADLGGRVIRGWMEGVPGMKVGGIRKLVIPPELAYGDRAMGEDLPPRSTLVFEIEVLGTR